MITISARKKSLDPVQEKLRSDKDSWNKNVSSFIDDVINLKKMINGKPSKYNMEKSKITEPIPNDAVNILSLLATKYSEIVSEGNQIISEQIEYSKNKKQPKPKSIKSVKKKDPDLTEQLSVPFPLSASNEYYLFSEGSGRVSRFLSKMKGPWFGNSPESKERTNRLSLLESVKDLSDLCSDFQVEILSTSENSIRGANKILLRIEDGLLGLSSQLDIISKVNGINLSEIKPETKLDKKEEYSNIDKIISDWNKGSVSLHGEISALAVPKMHQYIVSFNDSIGEAKKIFGDKIVKLYEEVLAQLSLKYGHKFSSLDEIIKINLTASEKIQIIASSSVRKWLKKVRHQYLPFAGKSSSSRLMAFDSANDMVEVLDQMMDSLEDILDVEYLFQYLSKVLDNFYRIREIVGSLLPEAKYYPSSDNKERDERVNKLVRDRDARELAKRMTALPPKSDLGKNK